jgi:farnesyl diphosphate synthase
MGDDDLRRGRPTVHRQWTRPTPSSRRRAPDPRLRAPAGAGLPPSAGDLVLTLARRPAFAAWSAARRSTSRPSRARPRPAPDPPLQPEDRRPLWSAAAGARMAAPSPAPSCATATPRPRLPDRRRHPATWRATAAVVGRPVARTAARRQGHLRPRSSGSTRPARARALVEEACDALAPYGAQAEPLREAARFVAARRK